MWIPQVIRLRDDSSGSAALIRLSQPVVSLTSATCAADSNGSFFLRAGKPELLVQGSVLLQDFPMALLLTFSSLPDDCVVPDSFSEVAVDFKSHQDFLR